jgi:hypothetical protein
VLCDATITYSDQAGAEHTVPLLDAEGLDLATARPQRQFSAYRGQKHFSGLWWATTTRSHVGYESWLERYWLIELDHDPDTDGIASQPFTLTWPSGGRRGFTEHTPDFVARRLDGTTVVVDCRPARRITGDTAEKFAATDTACRMVNWIYLVLAEPASPIRYANLRWLAGYRHPRFADTEIEQAVLEAVASHRGLYDIAAAVGDPIRTLPVIYHLLWRGELVCSHTRPLTDDAIVRRAASGEVTGITGGGR